MALPMPIVAEQAARFLAQPLESLNLITLHLGNGASVSAVEGGRSIDTSMGLTPLEGLIMGTRCGDIDPAIIFTWPQNRPIDRSHRPTAQQARAVSKGFAASTTCARSLA